MSTSVQSHRAAINGLDMYYETRGSGEPLVLVHGAILVDMGPMVEALARDYLVITPHLQGRGHTPDIDRPFNYEQMARDVAVLLAHMGIASADFAGQSMGAGVLLRLALQAPTLVRRLVSVSTAMASDGWHTQATTEIAAMETDAAKLAAEVKASGFGKTFPETNWESLFRKTGQFQQQAYDLSGDVGNIAAETLLVFGDEDAVRPEHMVAFWHALGGGSGAAGLNGPQRSKAQLAVIPGTNHSTVLQSPVFVEAVRAFLRR